MMQPDTPQAMEGGVHHERGYEDDEEKIEEAVELLRQATRHVTLTMEERAGLDTSIGDRDAQGDEGGLVETRAQPSAIVDEQTLQVDAIIKTACIRVAMASLAGSGAGLSTLAALSLGFAASSGITTKLQSDMINDIAKVYGHKMSSEAQQRTLLLLSGFGQSVGSRETATVVVENAIQAASVSAKTQAVKALALKAAPVIAALSIASINTTATYLIGERAKVLFSQGEEALESWADSARALSGFDERKLAQWLVDSRNLMSTTLSQKLQRGRRRVRAALFKLRASLRRSSKHSTEDPRQKQTFLSKLIYTDSQSDSE